MFNKLKQSRDERSVRWGEDVWQDLRYGARILIKKRQFTLVAVITLALGIAANTVIFTVINAVLLRPLGFQAPDRLLMLWTENPAYQLGFREFPAANADLAEWRVSATSFEQIAGFKSVTADLSDDGGAPERIGGVEVTANLLPLLCARPMLGRFPLSEEEQLGRDQVVIISHDLWQRRFGGDPGIIEQTIAVNGARRSIIGVMPQDFHFPRANEMPQAYHFPEKTDVWIPLARKESYWQSRAERQLVPLIGRLKAGVTQAQAQIEMDNIAARQARDYPQTHSGWRIWLTPLFNQVVGPIRKPLLMLLSATGILLLVACINIACLLLAHAASRRHELALRAAIGAGRSRIIRQLLTENLLLAMIGGSLGLLLSYWGLDALRNFIPPTAPRLQDISLGIPVFLFAAALSVLTSLVFGLGPAWQATKMNLTESINNAGRANSRRRGLRSHGLLVTAEVALATVLLVGAVLMVQSFRRLLAIDPGFKPEGVATFEMALPLARYRDRQMRAQFIEQARGQLSTLPGIRAVGAVSNLPLSGSEKMDYIVIEGTEPPPRGKEPLAEDRAITPGYFKAMGMHLVSGRDFDVTDSDGKPPVAIVNETLARRFFLDGKAVGKRIKRIFGDDDWKTIVGIVSDVRGFTLEEQGRLQLYYPHAQHPHDTMTMTMRADAAALFSLRSSAQQELKRLDAAIPVANFRMMPDLLQKAVARPRFSALLLSLFAATALTLTVVGLYSVVAYGVNQRIRELGIRMALGANRRNVLALIIRQGMLPVLIGVGIGLIGAMALTGLLASQLYEIKPTDPVTFGVVTLGLLFISILGCYIPARRAAKIDPIEALRRD